MMISLRLSLICIFIIVFNINLSYSRSDIDKLIEFQAQKFKYILETAYKNHPDSLDVIKISDEAFAALLQSIDKESYYYNKRDMKLVQEGNKGITYGIGIEAVSIYDTLYVIQVQANSPANQSGIEIGDIITQIEGRSTLAMMKKDFDELIQGDSATYVNIEIQSVYSGKKSSKKVLRKDIPIPGITASYIFPGTDIGIIVISRFSENVAEDFTRIANVLIKKGMNKIVVDMRGNPGGYMTKVDEILDLFIPGKKLLTKTVSPSADIRTEIYSNDGDLLEKIPVVALIDENSASGSELLAGVLQDYDRGIVVGRRSYGKGTIQKIWSMNDTTGFKLTVGKYQTPSGRDIQKYPDELPFMVEKGLDTNFDADAVNKKIREMGTSKIKVFQSESGRHIIGGGGIFPDKIVDNDTLTQLTQLLIRRGMFFKWAVSFKNRYGKELLDKYGNDYSKFNMEFQITDEMLREFAQYALENKVWNNEMFTQDKRYFITYQKAVIANVLWGYNAFSEVLSIVDNELVAAVRETVNAAEMINK
ncbi:MAG: PDZ domain-containing protein [Candidatus Kapabacteria bacterium]|nr:PDZ domain-containing protein [Ignavibacteriota bacterium]MCW5885308.1 PDZ domain-containing protein [Candidatus Kapabacteria bacterium]